MKTEALRLLVKASQAEDAISNRAPLVAEDLPTAQHRQPASNIRSIAIHRRAEMVARTQPSQRKPGEAQRFDSFLQSRLAGLDRMREDGHMQQRQAV